MVEMMNNRLFPAPNILIKINNEMSEELKLATKKYTDLHNIYQQVFAICKAINDISDNEDKITEALKKYNKKEISKSDLLSQSLKPYNLVSSALITQKQNLVEVQNNLKKYANSADVAVAVNELKNLIKSVLTNFSLVAKTGNEQQTMVVTLKNEILALKNVSAEKSGLQM